MEHSEDSEDSECSEECGGRRTGQTGQTGPAGSGRWDFLGREGEEERVRGMDAMRGCGCSGEQPYFLGGL